MRRQLGRRLRGLREEAATTMRAVQDAKLFSESKLARIEAGRIPVKAGDVWSLCRFYGASGEMTDVLTALAERTRSDAWWESRPRTDAVVAPSLGLYVGLEAGCSRFCAYHPELVHGLVQTEEFARAVIATDGTCDDRVIADRLRVRLDRKRAALGRPRRDLRIVLGAGALSMSIGSPAVRAGQLAHLCELDAQPGIDIRVRPWDVVTPEGLKGPFTLLDFEDPDDPSVVYLELLTGACYLDQEPAVSTYRHAFTRLHEQSRPIGEYTP